MDIRNWDGSSELRVPVLATSDLSISDFTIAALVKPAASASPQGLVAGYDSVGDYQWSIGLSAGGLLNFDVPGTNQAASSGGTLVDGTYYLVAFHKSGSIARGFHIITFDGAMAVVDTQHVTSDLGGGFDSPDTTAGGHLRFGESYSGLMPIVGMWPAALDNAAIEALVADLGSDDWLTTGTPAGVWNFDQTTNTDDVPDLTATHDTITGTISGGTDKNGITGTTIVDATGLVWDFTTTPPPIQWSYRFSGGAANDDPALSIGGAESSEEVATALLADVVRGDAVAGLTRYVGTYVHNDSVSQPAAVSAYFSELSLSSGVTVAMAVAAEAAGATIETLASSSTAPAGVAFTTPFTEEGALDLGTIDGGEGKGLWVRVIVAPNSSGALHNGWEITINDVPL